MACVKGGKKPAPHSALRQMGAGASTGTLPANSNAELAAQLAANATLPAANITPAVKEFAVRLKMALSTRDGWEELQQLFKSLRASLDEAVSSEEWSSLLHQNEDLCNKYFGQVSPEEIMDQFNRLDEEYVADGTGSNRAAGLVCLLSAPTNRVVSLCVLGRGKSQLDWGEFVDGAISLSAAVSLTDALSTVEGEAELKELFDSIPSEDDGRVALREWGDLLLGREDVLVRFLGLDAGASPRFTAFFMTGRFVVWVRKTFRRLGFNDDAYVTWDEFRAGGQ